MDGVVRWFSILVEWLILAGLLYFVLLAVQLILTDIGMPAKYMKGINMVLMVVGIIVAVFMVAHLTTFYPGAF